MGEGILILLGIHAVVALALVIHTLRKGALFKDALRWGAVGLVFGFGGVGIWSWAFRDDWGLWYKLQGIIISFAIEAIPVFFLVVAASR